MQITDPSEHRRHAWCAGAVGRTAKTARPAHLRVDAPLLSVAAAPLAIGLPVGPRRPCPGPALPARPRARTSPVSGLPTRMVLLCKLLPLLCRACGARQNDVA